MICKQCGEENNERFAFCTGCGASLKSPPLPDNQPTEQTPALAESGAREKLEQARREEAARLTGKVLDGKYRLNSVIGVGRMSAVYNATRLKIDDEVAVKILHPEGGADSAASADGFRREAQVAARFKHPNAAMIYDFDVTEKGLFYIVRELIAGDSLRQIIDEQVTLSPQTASVIATQVCDALDEAHRIGLIHGGIEPHNIIVNSTPSGGLRVKLLDFGLAKLFGAKASDLKKPGAAAFPSLRYLSPEQCLGEEIDGRSDIYSFGIVLYEMLGGAAPFDAPTSAAIAVQHVAKPPVTLRQLNPEVPPSVEAVVMRSLEKQREARQQTAADLARELYNAIYVASDDASQTHPSGGFISNSSPPPPAKTSGSGSFVPADIPAVRSTPVSGSRANSDLPSVPPPPSANPRGDITIAPPTFASNLSYRERKGNSGKFFLIAGVALAFLIFAAVAANFVWRLRVDENQNTPVKTDTDTADNSASAVNDPGSNLSLKPSNAEEELSRIRAELDNAASGRQKKSAIERDLKNAESRYPDDYRFAYQRAKLQATVSKSHHEAFERLFQAGEKAIKAGKSADLLSDLQRDGSSSLKRLTDHREWTVLETALRKNDSKALKESGH